MSTSFIFKLISLTLILTVSTVTSHAQLVSKAELVIHYSFDSDSLHGGDVLDHSENGYDGLIRGSNLKIVNEGMVNPTLRTCFNTFL